MRRGDFAFACRMNPRAFSLLELLVVLAVLVAVSGIALPSLLGRLEGTRLDTALTQFGAAVVTVRMQAQERGEAVELLCVGRGSNQEIAARSFRPRTDEPESESELPLRSMGLLPEGLAFSLALPGVEDESRDEPVDPDPRPLRLAVFTPDGSVFAPQPVYLMHGDRTFEIVFNTWTGGFRHRELEGDEHADQELGVPQPPVEDPDE
jgi:prepilin-type N-terminal cleavage/methylation domain-containing protein